jgi:hypothetical protein
LLAGSQWAESIQDDAVLPTFGKTLLMLQNCHNKLNARKGALLEANPAAACRKEQFREVFQEI